MRLNSFVVDPNYCFTGSTMVSFVPTSESSVGEQLLKYTRLMTYRMFHTIE